jgi:hypothetical protein
MNVLFVDPADKCGLNHKKPGLNKKKPMVFLIFQKSQNPGLSQKNLAFFFKKKPCSLYLIVILS